MIFKHVTLKKDCNGVVVLHAVTDCGGNFTACETDTINAILNGTASRFKNTCAFFQYLSILRQMKKLQGVPDNIFISSDKDQNGFPQIVCMVQNGIPLHPGFNPHWFGPWRTWEAISESDLINLLTLLK